MTEYAFDIKLNGVCRVEAATEIEARQKMHEVIDCIDIGYCIDDVTITEVGQMPNDNPTLFEVDGEDPPFPSEAHYIAAALEDGWLPADSDTAKEYCETMGIDASKADPKEAR